MLSHFVASPEIRVCSTSYSVQQTDNSSHLSFIFIKCSTLESFVHSRVSFSMGGDGAVEMCLPEVLSTFHQKGAQFFGLFFQEHHFKTEDILGFLRTKETANPLLLRLYAFGCSFSSTIIIASKNAAHWIYRLFVLSFYRNIIRL